jgi:hypothetical protein
MYNDEERICLADIAMEDLVTSSDARMHGFITVHARGYDLFDVIRELDNGDGPHEIAIQSGDRCFIITLDDFRKLLDIAEGMLPGSPS